MWEEKYHAEGPARKQAGLSKEKETSWWPVQLELPGGCWQVPWTFSRQHISFGRKIVPGRKLSALWTNQLTRAGLSSTSLRGNTARAGWGCRGTAALRSCSTCSPGSAALWALGAGCSCPPAVPWRSTSISMPSFHLLWEKSTTLEI